MTDWRRKKDPSGAWLAINGYVPDGVIVISATHCEADTFRSVNVKHPDYYVAHKDHYTHWAPIRRPGMIAEPLIMGEILEAPDNLSELQSYIAGITHACDMIDGRIGEMKEGAK